jgi:uncharacterized heparinase superfamily protein
MSSRVIRADDGGSMSFRKVGIYVQVHTDIFTAVRTSNVIELHNLDMGRRGTPYKISWKISREERTTRDWASTGPLY